MRSENFKVNLSVEFVPVSLEREAAFRQALRILAELIRELIESERSPGPRSCGRDRRGGLRSWHQVGIGLVDALSYPHYSTVGSV
jgi:hypothetical protein